MAVIVIGFLILALLNTLTSSPEGQEPFAARTTLNPKPSGYRVLYLWLKEQNLPVIQWMREPKDLGKRGPAIDVLVLVDPEFYRDVDMEALLNWAGEGHTLIYIGGNVWRRFDALDIASKSPEYPTGQWTADRRKKSAIYVTPAQPSAYTAGVHTVAVTTDHRLVIRSRTAMVKRAENDSPGPSAHSGNPTHYVSHLEDRTGSLLTGLDYGKGRVVLMADPDLGANWNVAKEDNGLLLLNLLNAHRRDGFIAFDEYHHGYREAVFAGYLKNSFWFIGFVQLLVLALCYVYSQGKRFARPLPVRVEDRQSSLEYVHAMAHLYMRAHAYNQALGNIYHRFKTRLCRKNGLASSLPAQEIARRIGRKGVSPADEFLRTLIECEAASQLDQTITPESALDLAQKLRKYERLLKL